MKKLLYALTIAAIICALGVTVVCARSSGHKDAGFSKGYSVCTFEKYTESDLHKHNSVSYGRHYLEDGHTYHNYCNKENCPIAGYHEQNGQYCFKHNMSDGYGHTGAKRRHHQ